MGLKMISTVVVSLAIGAGIGIAVDQVDLPGMDALSARTDLASQISDEPKILYWVAPMDPNYRRDAPGKSPMGMDLIPVYEGDESKSNSDPTIVSVSPAVANNFGVRVETVERRSISTQIETVGFVSYNDDQTTHVHVRASGWIEKLHVRSVGEKVSRGQLLIEFFSPELATAAFEYVREIQRQDAQGTAGGRRKLESLGVSERQIQRIGDTLEVPDLIEVYAPQDGVIVTMNVAQGMFISPDTTIMSVTELSSVWIIAEVFESQSSLVREGMVANVSFAGYPEKDWRGTVDYVYPAVDPKSRTLQVRIPLDNAELLMRPNMFGFVALLGQERQNVLVVDADALIRTGDSERVVVALGDGLYKPVEVRAGLVVGDVVEILEGVNEGEEIVVSAQFLLDSESSIAAGFRRLENQEATNDEIVTTGTVDQIDIANGSVTISHGPVPELNWPSMTMDFYVMDGGQLENLAAGDQIQFEVMAAEGGAYAIDKIQKTGKSEIFGQGVIHGIMKDTRTVNLTHSPIPEINWPTMTMDFGITAEVDISQLEAGQEIRFELAEQPDGSFRIASITPLPSEESAP